MCVWCVCVCVLHLQLKLWVRSHWGTEAEFLLTHPLLTVEIPPHQIDTSPQIVSNWR